MKGIIFIALFFIMFLQLTYAASPREIMVKGKTPPGIVVKNKSVTIKKGYTVVRVSKGKANLIGKIRGGGTGIIGTFDCTCNGKSGGCDVIVTGSSVSCAVSSCTSSCYMIVTIPSAGNILH